MTLVTRCDWKDCDYESTKAPNDSEMVEVKTLQASEGVDLCPNHLEKMNSFVNGSIGD